MNTNRAVNIVALILTAAAIASVATYGFRSGGSGSGETPSDIELVDDWQSYASEGLRIGPSDAEIVLVLFSDIRCRFCQETWKTLNQLRMDDPGRIALVYRHFPLAAFGVGPAQAAICADQQGVFVELYDRFVDEQAEVEMRTQQYFGPDDWMDLAERVGLPDVQRFGKCLLDPNIEAMIERDMAEGDRLGVTGIPTTLVNGSKVRGSHPVEVFEGLVETVGTRQ